MPQSAARLAVVGHVEWVRFARVPSVPRAGQVVHASEDFEEPAGGGAVAAVQLARLGGGCKLFTALGEDELGRRSAARLAELGVQVHARYLAAPTRTAVTLVDAQQERTITTFGPRLEPTGEDAAIEWTALEGTDAVYFTAGDRAALALARDAARVLVASPRAYGALGGGVPLDALVLSGEDETELREAERARKEARVVVYTEGARGGRWVARSGEQGRYEAAPAPVPGADSYGCGDSFAAALAFGLADGLGLHAALDLAARCGAACLGRRGPYGAEAAVPAPAPDK